MNAETIKYVEMQRQQYNWEAAHWNINNKDFVVGPFDAHNMWKDYDDYLFRDIIDLDKAKALDFGCGPGRNIVRFFKLFHQIDGIDFINVNLWNAKIWLKNNNIDPEKITLYEGNGWNLENIKTQEYDIVYSTIVLQHMCVWELRHNYFLEFYRVLKNGGWLCVQMGFGPQVPTKNTVPYDDNYYGATGTNGLCDVRVESPDQLSDELLKIGFTEFRHWIRPTGPGDGHPNWIFFQARV